MARELKVGVVRETYRCMIGGDAEAERILEVLEMSAESRQIDSGGLVEDLAAVVEILFSIGGPDSMDVGRSLVNCAASKALVALAGFVKDLELGVYGKSMEDEALRRGVRFKAPNAVSEVVKGASRAIYDRAIQEHHPSEEALLAACAKELQDLAEMFGEADEAEMADACRRQAERLQEALDELPVIMGELREIEEERARRRSASSAAT